MAFTYDLSTEIGQVRLLIPDRVDAGHVFEDDEIQAFLALEGTVREATAGALETIASDQAMVLKVMRLLDLQTDGAKVSDALLARAAKLRQEAENDLAAAGEGWAWAEMVTTDFAARERIVDESLRDG